MFFADLCRGIENIFFPNLCECCGKPLLKKERVMCMACVIDIPETGYHNHKDNETVLRFAGRIPFVHATSYAYFVPDGLLQHLLHGLKYKNRKETGIVLGELFAENLKTTDWIFTIDMIIPVPLHKKKELERGYNQSMLIAEGMSKILNIPANKNMLLRVKNTESQTKKTRSERIANMKDAFMIANIDQFKNKHVLLIDDVLTTGATLEASATELLKVENIKISIATIGIA